MTARRLLRYRDVGELLAISESQVRVYVRRGYLTEVRLPHARAVRFDAAEVESFAQRILAGGRRYEPSTTADAKDQNRQLAP